MAVCVEHGLRRDEADITLALAHVHLRRRELDAAEACARDVLALADHGRLFRADGQAWKLIGTVSSERGDHDAARKAFGAAVGVFMALELSDESEACRDLYQRAATARGTLAS